jgi:RecJ-like exonuclease
MKMIDDSKQFVCTVCEGDGSWIDTVRVYNEDYSCIEHFEIECPQCSGSGYVSLLDEVKND